MTAPALHRVVILVRDGVIPMEIGIPHRLFGEARSPEGKPLYAVLTAALHPGPVVAQADFALQVPHGPEMLAPADTVIIPASEEDYDSPTQGALTDDMRAALALIRPGTRVASICTGAFILAAAGMLDGRPATTHWKMVPDFQDLFPQVDLDPNVLFTEADGAPTVTNWWSKALVPPAGIAATRRVPALAALYAATAASSAGKALAGVAPAVAWA